MNDNICLKTIVDNASLFDGIEFQDWAETEHICREFDIHDSVDIPDGVFKEKYLARWMCTDTIVGISLTYFQGEVACVNHQPYRKSNKDVYWASSAVRDRVRDYIRSRLDVEVEQFKLVDDRSLSPFYIEDNRSLPHYKNHLTLLAGLQGEAIIDDITHTGGS